MSDRETIVELASFFGIEVAPGETPEARLDLGETVSELLNSLGLLPFPGPMQKETGRKLLLEQWSHMLDPVIIFRQGQLPLEVQLRLPEEIFGNFHWTIKEENGAQHSGNINLGDLVIAGRQDFAERSYVCRIVPLKIKLPWGYHNFTVQTQTNETPSLSATCDLIIVPDRCYIPTGLTEAGRIWGIGIEPHALRSRRNWGIGDLADIKNILTWSSKHGAGTLFLTPLHAPYYFSHDQTGPYSPSSRMYLNTLFLNIPGMQDFAECEEAKKQVQDATFRAKLATFHEQEDVDFAAVAKVKYGLLHQLWRSFRENHLNPESGRGNDFRLFQQQEGELLRYYSLFETLQDHFSSASRGPRGWRDWPEEYRTPDTEAVSSFASENQDTMEFHQYLQWQVEIQLAEIGRRSMELGLRVGLFQELAFSVHPCGFEAWYFQDIYSDRATVSSRTSHSTGLPTPLPFALRGKKYIPFIKALQTNMRYSGALMIKEIDNYWRASSAIASPDGKHSAHCFLRYSFQDFLGLIALESTRNKCLVIVDGISALPEELQRTLRAMQIFENMPLYSRQRDSKGKWFPLPESPSQAATSFSNPYQASIKDFWYGTDIDLKSESGFFLSETDLEKEIIARSTDRAHLLITLRQEELLPEQYTIDPLSVSQLDGALINNIYLHLARTPVALLIVPLSDVLGLRDRIVLPGVAPKSWQGKYPQELEQVRQDEQLLNLFASLRRERGIGVVRPSGITLDRKKNEEVAIPCAFYRLQLNKDFTFLQAVDLIPYLKELGISHCYTSSFLKARPGSMHGYDIIDHSSINPEIGSREDFERFIAVLEKNQLALLLDIVPNHMGIGPDNQWWMDVLENGKASMYASYFDINWEAQAEEMRNRVLLPVLGDHYGRILEQGELKLGFDQNEGSFSVHYYDQRFPAAPTTYSIILGHDIERLEERLGVQHAGCLELRNISVSFSNLAGIQAISPEDKLLRHRNKETNKRLLARICREIQEVRQFVEENIILFNGEAGKPESFDLLHLLLKKQPYQLAFWRVASDEINYRRFFDINDLAGIRTENIEVFKDTHKLILDLIATGKVDGLRIDHPDGLYDPYQYFLRLQRAAAGLPLETSDPHEASAAQLKNDFLYLIVEKILADFEHLPSNWPVHGTTGYDFANNLNGLFVNGAGKQAMNSIYHRFIGSRMNFDTILYTGKKLIIKTAMSGELNVLATMLYHLAKGNRHTQDFTLNRLRDVLMEVIACFPVYRTYISSGEISKREINYIEWAVAKAKAGETTEDTSTLDYIRSVLLLEKETVGWALAGYRDLVMKFQQLTGPVMAKGLEDTSFYVYNRLVSLNEVGGDPRRFGVSVAAFHKTNQERANHWPHAMLTTSTHDSKRSEDVRARINVLTEIPEEWKKRVTLWGKLNRPQKRKAGRPASPSKNDEYAFYQNLLGVWPLENISEESRRRLVDRVQNYMLKAAREAKIHTSWLNQNQTYEEGLTSFVRKILADGDGPFLRDFLPFQQKIAWFGMLNSLSQVLLKLTAPGVPDIYQGNETWRFCLVDPDSRRPVDFEGRKKTLAELHPFSGMEEIDPKPMLKKLLDKMADGNIKMYITFQTLNFRKSWRPVFEKGDYLPLSVKGRYERHICAYARKWEEKVVIVAAPRMYAVLLGQETKIPLGRETWKDTEIIIPEYLPAGKFRNIFSGEVESAEANDGPRLPAASIFRSFPLALLASDV